jgi:hypothetical protein
MTAGDFLKVLLWVEGEEAFVDIRLAKGRTVHKHWIAVEAIQVRPYDWMRLKRLIDAPAAMHIEEPAQIDLLLIRASLGVNLSGQHGPFEPEGFLVRLGVAITRD